MADTLDSLKKELESLKDSIDSGKVAADKVDEAFTKIIEKVSKLGKSDAIAEFTKNIQKTKEKVLDLASSLRDLSVKDVTDRLIKGFDIFKDSIEKARGQTEDLEKQIGKIALSTIALNSLPTPKLFDSFKTGTESVAEMTESFDNFTKLLGVENNELVQRIRQFTEASDRVNRFQDSLYSAAAASGQLNQYLQETKFDTDLDTRMDAVNAKMREMSKITYDVAQANGLNMSTVSQYAAVLSRLPGAFDSVSDAAGTNALITTSTGASYQKLDAAIKIARASGQEVTSVLNYMVESQRNLNTSAQDSISNFAKMSTAAQNLNLPFDIMNKYVQSTADGFMYFKDNTNSLIDVMSRLGPAFRAANLSPEAIQKLTAGMVNNINQMSLAQRAFLAMQTGGSGGLRGGYEIELLKSQGKFAEIEKKVEESLRKQFGGRVITLQEAARDEGAARQLAKQVQLVTTGPTKVVGTEAEAYKLFEAMRSGITGEVVSSSDALRQNLEIGDKIAEQSSNKLTDISNKLEDISMNTSIMARSSYKDVEGLMTSLISSEQAKQGFAAIGKFAPGISTELSDLFESKNREESRIQATKRSFFTRGSVGVTGQLSPNQVLEQLMNQISNPLPEINIEEPQEIPLGASLKNENAARQYAKNQSAKSLMQPQEKTYNVNITIQDPSKEKIATVALSIVKDQLNIRQINDTQQINTGAGTIG